MGVVCSSEETTFLSPCHSQIDKDIGNRMTPCTEALLTTRSALLRRAGVGPSGLILALLLAIQAPARPPDVRDRIDAFVRAEMERQKIPGVAVAVVKNGEVIRAEGYGYANVEHQAPVRAQTIFQSGSLGKQFTAATVMLLVEEGKIALADSITKYLPDAPEGWQPITVRHLLTHTSGIPDYTPQTLDMRRDYKEEELVRLASGLKLEFPAGSRWNYSNTGYVLLGSIIHKASGRFYGEVLQERVLKPLGMKTARIISEEDVVPNRAAGYRLVKNELKNQEWVAPQLNTTADGSLYFSVLDLIAWDKGLRSGTILSAESWAQVFEAVRLNSGKTYPYGFGWNLAEVAGQEVQRHGGAWQGFKTHLARYLADDLTIVVLANLAQADPERLVDGIAAILNPKLAPLEPKPIPDREPEVTARLKSLLAAASEGRLGSEEFAYVRAGFFPKVAKTYAELLRDLGALQRLDLVERRELGDDRVYGYDAAYAGRSFRVRLGLAPDDKVSIFDIRQK
jgi:CubicO group peptidase (beta-lactamase class C family)